MEEWVGLKSSDRQLRLMSDDALSGPVIPPPTITASYHSRVSPFEISERNLALKHQINAEESGLGEVWIGELREASGSHQVAVKRYPSAWAQEELEMFRRETAVLFMAAMRCHNVCKVYGTAVLDGKLCIVMKLYRESLQGLLKRTPGNRLTMGEVRRYGSEICKAVAELHGQNIILQDLKPPNILLDDYDHCVVADFGISKVVQSNVGLHMPSNVQGTFNYMSPEAFDPEQFGGISNKTDAWSFACTILEMATGTKPWAGMKMAPIVRKVMEGVTPEIPPGFPQDLHKILTQCFQYEPQTRPTFEQIYAAFKAPWEDYGSATPGSGDLLGLAGFFDVFKGQGDSAAAQARGGAKMGPLVPGNSQGSEEVFKGEIRKLQIALKDSQSQLEPAKKEVTKLQKNLRETQEQLDKTRREKERTSENTSNFAVKLAKAEQQLGELKSIRKDWERDKAYLSGQISVLEKEKQDILMDKMSIEVEVEELRRTLQEQQPDLDAKYQNEQLRLKVKSLQEEKTLMDGERRTFKMEQEILIQDRERCEEEIARLREESRTFLDNFQHTNEELVQLKGEMGSMRKSNEHLELDRKRLQSRERDVEVLDSELAEAQRAIASLTVEKRNLEASRAVIIEEFDAHKQKIQQDFERDKLQMQRKIDDLESNLDKTNLQREIMLSEDRSILSPKANQRALRDEAGVTISVSPNRHTAENQSMMSADVQHISELASRVQIEGRGRIADALHDLTVKSYNLQSGTETNKPLIPAAPTPQMGVKEDQQTLQHSISGYPMLAGYNSKTNNPKPLVLSTTPRNSSSSILPMTPTSADFANKRSSVSPNTVPFSQLNENEVLSHRNSMPQEASTSPYRGSELGNPLGPKPTQQQKGSKGLGIGINGNLVTQVVPGSRSAQAGIQAGDIIMYINGKSIGRKEVGNHLRAGLKSSSVSTLQIMVHRVDTAGKASMWELTLDVEDASDDGAARPPSISLPSGPTLPQETDTLESIEIASDFSPPEKLEDSEFRSSFTYSNLLLQDCSIVSVSVRATTQGYITFKF